jgi:hypothetical protein
MVLFRIPTLLSSAIFLFCSCSSSSNSAPVDPETTSPDNVAYLKQNGEIYSRPGAWKARITSEKEGRKLIVTGLVNVMDSTSKIGLKSEGYSDVVKPRALLLKLTREPVLDTEYPVEVNYEEVLKTEDQYKKIVIMYQDTLVTVISKFVN